MKRSTFSVFQSFFRRSNKYYANQANFHCTPHRHEGGQTNSSEPLVVVDYYSEITIIGLNRPTKKNALNSQLIVSLREELKKFESNPSSCVAVLHGVGGNFCAGLDLDDQLSSKPSIPLIDEFCCKPVIASVNGYAVGEGFDLAMACDVRIMDDQAIMGSFNRRFGVPMSAPALKRLSACGGLSFALDLILTGRPIKADESFQRGLVQQLAPCGSGKGNAITYAQSLIKFPQDALRADRAALFQSLALSDNFQKAVGLEISSRLPKALQNMQSESKKFSEGVGKHGTFKNLTNNAANWPEWMKS